MKEKKNKFLMATPEGTIKFKDYIVELEKLTYRTKEHLQAMRKAHTESGSDIWIYGLLKRVLIWAKVGTATIRINRKKISVAHYTTNIDTHAVLLEVLGSVDEKLEKTLYPWEVKSINGRVTGKAREIVVYDEHHHSVMDVVDAVEAIEKYMGK